MPDQAVTPDLVVIGVGGECRGDDAAGLEVVRLLRGRVPPSADVVESAGDPAGLVESWTGAGLAVVIDAVSSGAEPGTVRTYIEQAGSRTYGERGAASLDTAWGGGSHALGLTDAIGLGRALGRLPETLIVIGIEGGDFSLGAPVTPPVRSAIVRTAGAVRRLLWQHARAASARPATSPRTPLSGG